MIDLLNLARSLVPVVKAAGDIQLKYYRQNDAPDADIIDKHDGSPVTLADQESEKLIAEALKNLAPDIPMVGEESVAAGSIPDISGGRFFLVDPLDGTREFITGGGDFTVNIGLLENFKPVMGIIFAPVTGKLFFGANGQAFEVVNGVEKKISVRPLPAHGLSVVASKRHTDFDRLKDFLADKKVNDVKNYSSSLKFCALAAGEADIYPRLGPTSEWDTAAGEAILNAAGGRVETIDGKPMPYGKIDRKFANGDFVAFAAA